MGHGALKSFWVGDGTQSGELGKDVRDSGKNRGLEPR